MRTTDHAQFRMMPRVKHVHEFNMLVGLKGNRVRYGCIGCPAIDPYWYRQLDSTYDAYQFELRFLAGPKVQTELARRERARIGRVKALQSFADSSKTSGWLSGSGGTVSDPQGAAAVAYAVQDSPATGYSAHEGFSTFGQDQLVPVNAEQPLEPEPTAFTEGIVDESDLVEVEFPSAEQRTTTEPIFTRDKLEMMKKQQLQTIATSFEIEFTTRNTKDLLIEKILRKLAG